MIYDLKKIKVLLADRNLSKVSGGTGLHVNTLRNILKSNDTDKCALSTAKKLTEYFINIEAASNESQNTAGN